MNSAKLASTVCPASTPAWETAIRTLGVSLVAIAAVAASLTIARQRVEQRRPEPRAPDGNATLVVAPNLDAIRAAGL